MGELSQIGQVPSSITPGSVTDAAPATNSVPSKVKPGDWAAPNYSDLDKAVKKDLDELVKTSANFAFDLLVTADVGVQIHDAKRCWMLEINFTKMWLSS